MQKEDDANLGFMFSYIAYEEVFLKVGKERVVQECNLLYSEIPYFRKKIKPWIDAGMISKKFGRNPFFPLEQEPIYFLTSIGKEYYQTLTRIL